MRVALLESNGIGGNGMVIKKLPKRELLIHYFRKYTFQVLWNVVKWTIVDATSTEVNGAVGDAWLIDDDR